MPSSLLGESNVHSEHMERKTGGRGERMERKETQLTELKVWVHDTGGSLTFCGEGMVQRKQRKSKESKNIAIIVHMKYHSKIEYYSLGILGY